jgi:hypothetical protein
VDEKKGNRGEKEPRTEETEEPKKAQGTRHKAQGITKYPRAMQAPRSQETNKKMDQESKEEKFRSKNEEPPRGRNLRITKRPFEI